LNRFHAWPCCGLQFCAAEELKHERRQESGCHGILRFGVWSDSSRRRLNHCQTIQPTPPAPRIPPPISNAAMLFSLVFVALESRVLNQG
jgi:hypothetical protein